LLEGRDQPGEDRFPFHRRQSLAAHRPRGGLRGQLGRVQELLDAVNDAVRDFVKFGSGNAARGQAPLPENHQRRRAGDAYDENQRACQQPGSNRPPVELLAKNSEHDFRTMVENGWFGESISVALGSLTGVK